MKKTFRSYILAFLAFALVLVSSCSLDQEPENGIGIQLYSARKAMKTDPAATIEKLGAMGFDFVEAAGYADGKFYGMEPLDFKSRIEASGMKFLGSHTGQSIPDSGSWEVLMPWWDSCIAAHKAAGVLYIVQPWMGSTGYQSIEGLKDYCDYFNAVGEKCNEAGILFGYHNHDREFTKIGTQVIYDFMIENTDPENVMFQLDLYWINEGGGVATEYFTKYPGRFGSFHIKDEKELGASGKMDFQSSFDMIETAGAKYQVVEVERYDYDPLVSIQMSLDYLKEIGFVK